MHLHHKWFCHLPVLITVLVLMLGSLFSNALLADTSVWKVSKDRQYFYLGGTVHLLSERDHPLPVEFERAYQRADIVMFEMHLPASHAITFQTKLNKAMMFDDHSGSLSRALSDSVYRKLGRFMASRNLQIKHYERYQPWAVGLVLTMTEYNRLGMKRELGIETVFTAKAQADNKKIMALESMDEQIAALSTLGSVDADLGIQYTLSDLDALPETIKLLKKGWRNGDMALLENSDAMQDLKQKFPDIYHSLLIKRNNNWMQKLPKLLDDRSVEFVMVGALHLSGEQGLLSQLQQQGYKVEPF